MKKEFRERINQQKKKDEEKHERTFIIKGKEVVVDINTCRVNTKELNCIMSDIFATTVNEVYEKNRIFHLNTVCDFSYDLKFLGVSKDKKLYFRLI